MIMILIATGSHEYSSTANVICSQNLSSNRPFHRKGKYARNVAQRNSACYDVICWSTLAITTTALFLSLEAHFSSLSLFS